MSETKLQFFNDFCNYFLTKLVLFQLVSFDFMPFIGDLDHHLKVTKFIFYR